MMLNLFWMQETQQFEVMVKDELALKGTEGQEFHFEGRMRRDCWKYGVLRISCWPRQGQRRQTKASQVYFSILSPLISFQKKQLCSDQRICPPKPKHKPSAIRLIKTNLQSNYI